MMILFYILLGVLFIAGYLLEAPYRVWLNGKQNEMLLKHLKAMRDIENKYKPDAIKDSDDYRNNK